MTDSENYCFAPAGLAAPPGTLGAEGHQKGSGEIQTLSSFTTPTNAMKDMLSSTTALIPCHGPQIECGSDPQDRNSRPSRPAPKEQPGRSSLVNTQAEFPVAEIYHRTEGKNTLKAYAQSRRTKDKLRSTAGAIVGGRIRRCGHISTSAVVSVKRSAEGRAHYGGVETCGSVWGCPVCAAKVSETRRKEVEAALDGHKAIGGEVYMAAFTVPHHAFQKATDLRSAVAGGWRKLCAGRPWLRAKEDFGLVGMIRSLEVTHGANGWHPHLHVLFLLPSLTPEEETAFSGFLFQRWRKIIERKELGTCTAKVWRFEKCTKTHKAGDYVAKWGCDQEITNTQSKRAKGGGRTPWMLLEDAGRDDKQASALFKEYFLAFFGARQLTWSRDLKVLYGVDDIDDETVAAEQPTAKTLVSLTPEQWRLIRAKRLRMTVLEAAETGGNEAVLAILNRFGNVPVFSELDKRWRALPYTHALF